MSGSLDQLIAEAGVGLAELKAKRQGGSSEYLRAGQPFAVVEGEVIELRLLPDIAEAALRTPSTGPSDRGPGWIRFAPPELDGHAIDRARAWFQVAWRTAGRRG